MGELMEPARPVAIHQVVPRQAAQLAWHPTLVYVTRNSWQAKGFARRSSKGRPDGRTPKRSFHYFRTCHKLNLGGQRAVDLEALRVEPIELALEREGLQVCSYCEWALRIARSLADGTIGRR